MIECVRNQDREKDYQKKERTVAMAGKGDGQGETAKLEKNIACIKYTVFCFNIIAWAVGGALFALTIWMASEPNFGEWITMMDAQVYYIGIYILIIASIVVMIVSFLGCCSALMEHTQGLGLYIGTQVLGFVVSIVGAAILLDFSTVNSSIQPILRRSLTALIMRSEHPDQWTMLKLIQESLGCCGADGSNDYIRLRQPLPVSCRDSVSGNAFFHGCVDELTWFLEDKSGWIAGLAVALSTICVIDAVLSIILIQALKKEEEEARTYRH